jgi:hypothetical protein
MSDANPIGIVAGEQYAQASPTPAITPKTMNNKILKFHGPGALEKYPGKGEFYTNLLRRRGLGS